ncbi:MAG: chorismate mutase [Deltaproteobacteria bacterium]|nr:chorismate mutase [Deltaproteobacteria bacterium]
MEYKNDPYAELRKNIDGIDRKILDLLNERARYALEIGEIKKKRNDPVYVPAREKDVLDALERNNQGPLSNETVISIFRTIIESVRKMESDLK